MKENNQTEELQINLAKFEELAKEFIGIQPDEKVKDLGISVKQMADWAIHAFKERIFDGELEYNKRKEEYIQLKKRVESMKEEFEP